jgi:hypothetical protein
MFNHLCVSQLEDHAATRRLLREKEVETTRLDGALRSKIIYSQSKRQDVGSVLLKYVEPRLQLTILKAQDHADSPLKHRQPRPKRKKSLKFQSINIEPTDIRIITNVRALSN